MRVSVGRLERVHLAAARRAREVGTECNDPILDEDQDDQTIKPRG
jgi:hypothetical protein